MNTTACSHLPSRRPPLDSGRRFPHAGPVRILPRTPLEAVVFDVDGTLVDSERDGHRVAFNQAFTAAGLPYQWDEVAYGDLLRIAGGRARLAAFLSAQGHAADQAEHLAVQLHADKTRRFVAMVEEGQVPPRPGAHRLLRELQEAGATLAVATTGSRAWVEPLLERAFPDITFTLVLTADEVPDRKPDPAVYRRAREALGLDPATSLVVEDAEKGLQSARRAGLECLVVVNDYTRHERFDDALLVVDGFGDDSPCVVRAGPSQALDRGRITALTCLRLRSTHAGRTHPGGLD
jgi:HAD superfamily hydrolase (TIGR01509 family)